MVLGRLTDRHRLAERVALRALGRHAAVPGAAVGIAPATALMAIQRDPVPRVLRTAWADGRRVGLRTRHDPSFLLARAILAGTLYPSQIQQGAAPPLLYLGGISTPSGATGVGTAGYQARAARERQPLAPYRPPTFDTGGPLLDVTDVAGAMEVLDAGR